MARKDQNDEVTKFIQDLKKAPRKETVLHGMVKADDEKRDGILFAPPGDCEHWAFVSRAAIETIKDVGRAPCGGHFHVLAVIHLKTPEGAAGEAYAAVADLHRTKLAKASGAAMGGPPPNFPCKHWVLDPRYGWICQD